jgi:hypothetical protein
MGGHWIKKFWKLHLELIPKKEKQVMEELVTKKTRKERSMLVRSLK